MAAQTQDFWGQFEVEEYNKPQYDWGQFEQVPQNKHALETSLNELPENDPYVKTQKHQTEQLANMLFTAEERKAIENKGEIGWWEYAKNYADLSEAIPFYGTGKQIAQTSKVYSIAKKLENGEEVTAADKSYMQDYLKKYTETQLRGTSWGAKGASMLIQAPAFIGEFIATGGVGATVGKAGIIAGVKGAGAAATKAAIKAGTKVATSKALSTIAGEQAVKTIGTKAALETSAKLAGKVATQQAVLVPMYAVQNYNEKKIADGLNLTDKGSDVLYNTQKADSSASWAKSFGIGEIEILSEMSGGLLGYMAGGVTRGITTAATKIGGKVATTNVARGISAVSAKVYNSIPKEARIKLEAAARLTDKLGKKLNTVSEKLKQPSIGFHGVAEEMGEERLGDVLKYAFDLDDNEGYSLDQLGQAIFPGFQQLFLEAGVFSIVGGGSFATRTVINNLKEKGYSDKEATTISQNLSEIEKENMANEILGEVKINEDIKEQEVIKEQVKIENAMLKGGISITENAQENTAENQKPKTLSDYKKDILSNKFDEGKIDTIKHKYNGRVINQVFKSEDNDFRYTNREFNKIINDIYKNPSIIDNKEEYDNLETQLESVINSLPYNDKEEVVYPYYEKFYNAINSAGEYLEAKKKKTKAAELYDMADTAGATPSQEEQAKKEWQEKGTDSKYFKKWFGDSKVVDESGKPKIVYRGDVVTFDTFDKEKASTESDMGAGFYFSDNEADVESNYYDGGPDFDNKVARRAEQIQQEREDEGENIDYDEAKKIAEKELRGDSEPQELEVYLSIKNPVYVGTNETYLLSDVFNDIDINEEDYEDYSEYEEARQEAEDEAIQTISYEIDDALGGLLSYDDIERAKSILFEYLYDGGVTLQQLKDRLNEEYFENYDTGDIVGNEVARRIAEALGYDGIIDDTVSTKFNMDMEEGTTHYIAFEPTQIKSVENQGTFDENNPNIYYDVEEESPRRIKKNYNSYNDFVKEFSKDAEEVPEDYAINNSEEALKDLGISEGKPRIIQNSYETINVRAGNIAHLIDREDDKTRYKSINKMFATLERPNIITINKDNTKGYFKIFKGESSTKKQIVYVAQDEQGNFVATTIPIRRDKKFIDAINKGVIVYDSRKGVINNSPDNNIIPDSKQNLNPSVKNNELYDTSEEAPKTLKEVEEIADKEAEKEEEKTGIQGLYSDFKQAFSEFIEPFYTEAVDRFAPIQNTVKRANKKGADLGIEITDKNWTENPYNLARMYSGLANRIWQHFKENTTQRAEDGTQKITGEGFGKIIEDLYKETKDIESNKETQLKDFEDYLIAKRFLLDLKDREGYEATEEQKLKAIQDMARLAEKYGEEMTTLEKLADRVYEYNRRTLHLLVDSGNMSQETYDKIIEQNPHHISYKRVMDENYGTNGLSFAKGKFTDAKSPIKKIRGSEREIQSIYKSTLEDTMRIIDVAERNLIARKTAELQKYLPEEIKPIKPLMDKITAKVKVTYDAKMRSQLEEAIKFFGRTFKKVKSIKTPQGYALGSYSEEEKEVRKKLGSQDRTLAHEVGHMLDFALDVENQIKNDSKIMQEIKTLAEDRFKSTVKLQDGEFITEDAGSTEKYKNYVQSNKEAIANAFDLYFTSRDYVKRVAPETAKFIDNLFKGEYAFLNEIRPSSETATEEILQDVWAPSKRKPSNNSIGYYEDGKLKFVEVPTNLMKSIEDLNPKQYGMISQAVDKLFKGSSDILRAGATLNPEFILRNPIRDVQEAWFNVEGFNPLIDVPKGLMSVIGKKNSKLYKEWQREGGAFNSYMELNEKTINEAIKLYEDKKPLIWKTLGFVPNTLEKLSSTLEESTRLGIYNAMLRKGLTPTQAAFMSREGTLDFARGGRFTKQANRYLTFLNAGVQGTDRVLRTIATNPKQALKVGMTMAMGQILLSGYYLYLAPDDDRQEYLEIPEYVKNVSYVFKAGDKWWKIPRPFAPGYIFEAIPEKFITWLATNEKPEGLKLFNFAKDLFTSASPITDPSDFIPVLPKIWIENTANYNFFTERQIYPDYLNQYSPKERYNKNTSETAKLLGEKLNMSPALIENAIRGQFGNAGKYALDMGDAMQDGIKKLLGEEVNERPKDISNVWGIRGFAVKDPIGNQSNSVNAFNKNFKELSETHNDYNKLQKESKQEAREFKEEHKEELRQYKSASESNKKIKELRKDINKILKDTKLSGEEKAEKIKTKEERMTEIARKANEKLKE